MRYIRLYEEFKGNRIKVTKEEKNRLREVSRVIIKYCKSRRLTSGINEKYRIEFDLGELRNIIGKVYPKELTEYINNLNKDNGYKILDDYAKKLSSQRGTDIIFDRKNGCFTTSSGKALTTINVVSEYPNLKNGEESKKDGVGGYRTGINTYISVNYTTGDIVNNNEDRKGEGYFRILDFTGDNIFMSINRNIRFEAMLRLTEDELGDGVFSTLYHEFIHSKDPLTWKKDYLDNKEIYGVANGGVYASHDTEVQTLSNEFLELIGYYFEITLRGDSDGNGVNYNLTKEDINNNFIPNILEIVDFIDGKIDKMSDKVLKSLKGKLSMNSILNIQKHIVDMRKEDPEDGKVIRQWMREDFIQLVDYYNSKVIEINKRKEKGNELRLLHKGFPFEITTMKPTPQNVRSAQIEIEKSPKTGILPKSTKSVKIETKAVPAQSTFNSSYFKFLSNGNSSVTTFNANELINLIEKYSRVFTMIYSKYANSPDIDTNLKTLLREVKTKDNKRIKEAVKNFFDDISKKISDSNVKRWLQTSDGRKWGESIANFEKMCSLA